MPGGGGNYSLGKAVGEIVLKYNPTGGTRAKKDVQEVKKEVEKTNKEIDKTKSKTGDAGKSFKKLENVAGGVGLVVAAGFAMAVKSAAGFEQGLANIQAVSGATTAEMDLIRKKALQLGKDTKYSAAEAASAMEELIKAGLTTEEVLGGAADAAVSLAAAGGVDIKEAATIASNAMAQFNLKAKDMVGVVDQIAGAANASAIDVHEFGYSLQMAGAVANLNGITFKDTATAIALLGKAGIKGSDAGTSLKTMFGRLQPMTKATTQAFYDLGLLTFDAQKAMQLLKDNGIKPLSKDEGTLHKQLSKLTASLHNVKEGSGEHRKEMDKMLQSAGAINNAFFDQKGNVKSLADVSGLLNAATKDMTAQNKQATLYTIFGSDAIRAAAILTKEGSTGFNNMAKAMGKVKAADVAATKMNTLSGNIEQLKGSLETTGIIIGSYLIPKLTALVKWLTGLVNWFANLSEGQQKTVATILASVGALGLFAAATIKVVRFTKEFVMAIRTILALKAVASVIKAIGGAVRFLTASLMLNPFVLAAIALAALVVGFIYAYKHSEKFRKVVDGVVRWIREKLVPVFVAVGKGIVAAFKWIVKASKSFAAVVVDIWKAAVPVFVSIGKGIAAVFKWIVNAAMSFARGVRSVWDAAWTAVSLIVKIAMAIIKTYIKVYLAVIGGIIKAAMFVFRAAFALFKTSIQPVIAALQLLKNIFMLVFQVIRLIVLVQMAIMAAIIRKTLAVITAVWSAVWNAIKGVVSAVWAVITSVVTAGVSAVRAVVTAGARAVSAVWSAVWGRIKAVASAVWGAIRSVVSTGISLVRSVITGAINTISALWSAFWNSRIGGTARAGINAVLNAVRGIINIVKIISDAVARGVAALVNGFKGAVTAATSWIGDVFVALAGLGVRFYNAGVEMITQLIRGISAMAQKAVDTVKGIADKVASLIPGSPVDEGPLTVLNRGDAGKKIIQMVVDGIRSKEGDVSGAMTKAIGKFDPKPAAAAVPAFVQAAVQGSDLVGAMATVGRGSGWGAAGTGAALASSANRTAMDQVQSLTATAALPDSAVDAIAAAVMKGLSGARLDIDKDGVASIVSDSISHVARTGGRR